MSEELSNNSPLTQEQKTIFSLLASFVTTWEERRDYYLKGAMQESLNPEKHAELGAEFGKYHVEYDTEVLPLFFARFEAFLQLWAARKAVTDTVKDYQKWMRPYHSAVRLITKPEAPFPAEAKAKLTGWPPPAPTLKNALLREVQRYIEQDQGVQILDTNIEKAPGKHPVWQALHVELFQLLGEKLPSEGKRYTLIALLFTTLLPAWFPLGGQEHHADRIRLSIKRALKP